MGLDMYINAKRYLSSFDPKEKEISEKIQSMLGETPGVRGDEYSFVGKVTQVEVQAAYWRKANHVHAWFVRTVQEGRDECQETYVSREVLAELVARCEKILAGKTKVQKIALAKEYLPPQAGFFFGSTEIDNWYFEDLKQTIKQIKPLLDEKWHKEWSFYYRASW